jgi:hypothetical protein
MTDTEASKIVAMLMAGYPNWKPTEDGLRLYAKLLEPFDSETAQKAVMGILYSPREFAPPVGVLVEAITIQQLRDAGQYLSAEEAWSEVREAIHYVGYYGTPKFNSPALTRAVAALDWRDICSNENIEATRAHLMRIFGAMQERVMQESVTALVKGSEPSKQIANETPIDGLVKNIGKPIEGMVAKTKPVEAL